MLLFMSLAAPKLYPVLSIWGDGGGVDGMLGVMAMIFVVECRTVGASGCVACIGGLGGA